MHIAITTPTGHVGSHVVPMLVRAGLRPLVLLRDPTRLDPALRAEVEVREIDQFDANAVLAATRDVDALFWATPSPGGDDPLAGYDRAADALTHAVRENRIARVVLLSSVGAELRHGAGEIDGLARTEEALDDTGAAVTHLRCGYFFTNLELQLDVVRGGTIEVVVPTDAPMPWVAPRDIAEVAVTRLLNGDWTGRHVRGVHGPEDLTWDDAAEIVSTATGHPLRVARVPDDTMRDRLAGAGLGTKAVDAIMGMSVGLRDGFVPEQPRTVHTTTPTTLASWAYDRLRPLL